MTNKNQELRKRNNRLKEPEWIDLDIDSLDETDAGSADEAFVDKHARPPKQAAKKQSPENHSKEKHLTGNQSTERSPAGKQPDREQPVKRQSSGKQPPRKKPVPKKKASKVNFHVIFLALIAVVFVVIVFKLAFWDKRVRQNNEMEDDTTLSFDTEPLDSIIPLDASDVSEKEKDDDLRILFLGNGSLADDKTADTNMANIVQKKAGATVYNCAIPGSYMSTDHSTYRGSYPNDAFSFYFLSTLIGGNTETIAWAERDMGGIPEEIKESLDLLQSIDYNELDVLCIYYDGADYQDQRGSCNLDNETDVTTFCGALAAGIDVLQGALPNTRIIVMSPTYTYVVDKNGNYSSSFLTDILEEPLSTYVGLEAQTCMGRNVSFVDNFYGSVYEEIAEEYLKDHILLNEKGHALVADRFLYALNRFHDYDF